MSRKHPQDNLPRVAVAQVPVVLGDVAENLSELDRWVQEAVSQNIRFVIFPECYLSGYLFEAREEALGAAIPADGPELVALETIFVTAGIEGVVGFLERAGDKLYNSACVVGRGGIVGIYRKRHLPCLGLDRFVDEPPLTDLQIFDLDIGQVGVAICYEIRFPEVTRSLALSGADIIALPTNWLHQSDILAEDFARVRAAENLVYFLTANRPDVEEGAQFLGKSRVIDPLGVVCADAGTTAGLAFAPIDIARARDKTIVHKRGDFEISPFRDRRPESYQMS